MRAASAGRWGQVWDSLDPVGQRVVGREAFVRCLRRVASGAAIPLSDIPVRVLRVRDARSRATVEVEAATPVGPMRRTVEAVRVGDAWRLRLPPSLGRAFAAGRCSGSV